MRGATTKPVEVGVPVAFSQDAHSNAPEMSASLQTEVEHGDL